MRETYGAAVARLQGIQSTMPAVARAMRKIAVDEERHAALSWRIHEWLMPQLSERERLAVLEAMTHEIDATKNDVNVLDDASRQILGLPSPSQTRAILRVLSTQVWPAAHAA